MFINKINKMLLKWLILVNKLVNLIKTSMENMLENLSFKNIY